MNESPDFWEWLASQNLPRSSAEADLAHAAWVAAAEYTNVHGARVEAVLEAERDALRAQLDAAKAVMRQYENWYDGASEDSWRLERDMMVALGLEPLA